MKKLNYSLNKDEMAVILTEQNSFYYSGFRSTDGVLLCFFDEQILLVDGRYFEAAKNSLTNVKVVLLKNLKQQIEDIIKSKNIKKVFCENNITLQKYDSIKTYIGEAEIINDKLSVLIDKQREIKTDFEIDCIKKAQRIAEKSLDELLKVIKIGMTEKQIAAELEYRMKLNGADGISFDTIAVSGKNTSLPHGVPTDKKLESGEFLTLDFGAVYNGYHSDMTRTFGIGKVTDKMKNVYDTVLIANIEAFSSIKCGIKASDVDLKARNLIEESGFGEYFVHSTGHGVGLDIHESPNISFKNQNLLLENQVITVEPGIYLPNEFGVRIEDMAVVKPKNAENLTNFSKKLIII